MKRALYFLIAIILVGCASPGTVSVSLSEDAADLDLTSTAFLTGETIPMKYTCDGKNVSPSLAWKGVPEGTQSLVLIMDDPDAPIGTWVHWVVFNLPPDTVSLEEATSGLGVNGNNSWQKPGYGGPCPPPGPAHGYVFRLYALDTLLDLPEGASRAEVEAAMQGHILAYGELLGKYGR